jgi:HEAT repeat protein
MRPFHQSIAVTLLGLGAIVGYSFATRTSDESSNGAAANDVSSTSRKADQPIEDPATPVTSEVAAGAASLEDVASPESTSPETLAQWILDTRSANDDRRIAAIVALGQAPKAEAVPALQRVLESGEHERDRQTALRSLHTLAIQQGDDDQRIRDTLRSAIYHGDDEGVSQSAQAFLEDVEEVLGAGE